MYSFETVFVTGRDLRFANEDCGSLLRNSHFYWDCRSLFEIVEFFFEVAQVSITVGRCVSDKTSGPSPLFYEKSFEIELTTILQGEEERF